MNAETPYLDRFEEAPDEWHRHSAEEGSPQPEHAGHVSAPVLWIAFGSMVLFLVAVVGALIVYYDHYITNLRQERLETTRMAEEHGLRYEAEARAQLDSYAVVNAEAGTYQIPIDVAMDNVLEQYDERGE